MLENQSQSTRKLPVSPSRIRQIERTMAAMMSTTTAPRHGARCLGPVMPIVMAEMIPEAGGRRPHELRSDLMDSYRTAGVFTGRILKGAKPADLPVEQASKYQLVINLKSARALGRRRCSPAPTR